MNFAKTLCLLSLITSSIFAYADIQVTNNTDSFGTAKLTLTPCSSRDGSNGILQPHSQMIIPSSDLSICGSSGCDVHVYMSQNCSGTMVAKVQVSKTQGVMNIQNLDSSEFILSGGGSSITADSAKKGWIDRLLHWFM